MDVIIVSKTHMKNTACIGGILENGRLVRLLQPNGYNQDIDTIFEVGQVYTIMFSERGDKKLPHIEDILVNSRKYKYTFSLIELNQYLTEKLKVKIWRGSADTLFGGKLQWIPGGSGFISKDSELPDNSVGF